MRSRNPRGVERAPGAKKVFAAGAFVVFAWLVLPGIAAAGPWTEHASHLMALTRQMEQAEHEINELIEEKHHTTDPTKIAEIMKEISDKHKALEKTAAKYEEERRHVRFQHPEKNDTLDHNYVRHDVKSLEDMESDLGIEGRLDRIKARVLAKFPLPVKPARISAEIHKTSGRGPASKEPDEDAPEPIHLVK